MRCKRPRVAPPGSPRCSSLDQPGPAAWLWLHRALGARAARGGGGRARPGVPAPGSEGPRPLSGPGPGESGWPPKKSPAQGTGFLLLRVPLGRLATPPRPAPWDSAATAPRPRRPAAAPRRRRPPGQFPPGALSLSPPRSRRRFRCFAFLFPAGARGKMASRKEGSGAAGSGFGASKGKGKAATTGDSAVKQVQIDGLVSGGTGAAAGGGAGGEAAAAWSPRRGWPRLWDGAGGQCPSRGRDRRGAPTGRSGFILPSFPTCIQAPPVLILGEKSDSLPCGSEGRGRAGVNFLLNSLFPRQLRCLGARVFC